MFITGVILECMMIAAYMGRRKGNSLVEKCRRSEIEWQKRAMDDVGVPSAGRTRRLPEANNLFVVLVCHPPCVPCSSEVETIRMS